MLREKGLVDTLVAHMKTGWRPNGPAETAIVTMLLDDPRIAAQMTGPKKTASIKVRKARHLARTTSSSARPATDTTAIATGAIGAALGGVIGGPAGAIVGGLLGILIGAMTQQAKPKPRL
jgi:outer membrane lipoprotein SlyB